MGKKQCENKFKTYISGRAFSILEITRIQPRKKEATENLALYIIWASFSQE